MISRISALILPGIIALILIFGMIRRRPLFDDFTEGARGGMRAAADILPTIIGLIVSVRVLRASGFLDFLTGLLTPHAARLHFPAELLPLALVRTLSTSAANGLLLDLFASSGPDSANGFLASLLMSSTESVFYTISVYGTAARVTKSRWTLPGCLLATLAGIAASAALTALFYPGV